MCLAILLSISVLSFVKVWVGEGMQKVVMNRSVQWPFEVTETMLIIGHIDRNVIPRAIIINLGLQEVYSTRDLILGFWFRQ